MGKLTGVQILETVNGEITKVLYNGAEYKKIAETAFNNRVGDLILRTEEDKSWAGIGDFFEVIDEFRYVDNEGDYEWFDFGLFTLFRKTSLDGE